MASIVHIHWQFHFMGGGENVAMNTLEALQDQHQVTLLTDRPIDIDGLNAHFGTHVSDIDVQIPKRMGIGPQKLLSIMRQQFHGGSLGFFRPLPIIAAHWLCKPYIKDADLVINTTCEMTTQKPTIQFVHYPLHNRYSNPYDNPPRNPLFKRMNNLFLKLEGLDAIPDNNIMLTNSEWTADLVSQMYERNPRVVYPPIDTSDFKNVPPVSEREDGFVILGRITPGKNILRAIEIIERVRERGHDTHLHIIGATSDDEYATKVKNTAAEREFVFMEGQVPREELVQLLTTHRYGIHAQKNEHFGMAVAELAAAGALPFVHDSGGQRGIVNKQPELMYSDIDDAVETISETMEFPHLEEKLRKGMPNVEEKYGKVRFKNTISQIADEML